MTGEAFHARSSVLEDRPSHRGRESDVGTEAELWRLCRLRHECLRRRQANSGRASGAAVCRIAQCGVRVREAKLPVHLVPDDDELCSSTQGIIRTPCPAICMSRAPMMPSHRAMTWD